MFHIMGSYRGRTEEVDSVPVEEGAVEAARLLAEYRMAFGAEWSLWIEIQDRGGEWHYL